MSFSRNILVLSLLLVAIIGALIYFTGYNYVHPLTWYILLFFASITWATFYFIRKGIGEDAGSFQLYYFGSSVARVLLCMVVVFFYVYFATEREFQFAINFFIIYFIYTGFEIYSILSNLRRIS
ncbi:MAG: hypothetical protein ACO1OF_14800, partial [Adhaeribacter sp.]